MDRTSWRRKCFVQLAAFAFAGLIVNTASATEFELAKQWAAGFNPVLNRGIAPLRKLAPCKRGAAREECKRQAGQGLAAVRELRIYLEQNPPPPCLQGSAKELRKGVLLEEKALSEMNRSTAAVGLEKAATVLNAAADTFNQAAAAITRDVPTCSTASAPSHVSPSVPGIND